MTSLLSAIELLCTIGLAIAAKHLDSLALAAQGFSGGKMLDGLLASLARI